MDDEVKGNGNSVNYKYRMHDPRIGRFFAVDPLASEYPHNGPYNFSENKLIAWRELEGLESSLTIHESHLNPGVTNLVWNLHASIIDERANPGSSTYDMSMFGIMTAIEGDLEERFNKWDSDGNVHFYSKVNLEEIQSLSEASYSVVIHIVDVVPPPANDPNMDMSRVLGRVDRIGDEENGTYVNHIYLRNEVVSNGSTAVQRRTISHEVGHYLGLRHPSRTVNSPDSAGSPSAVINADDDPNNLMRQTSAGQGLNLLKVQINKIIRTINTQTNKQIYEDGEGNLTRSGEGNTEYQMD